jgi:hypothetical protein
MIATTMPDASFSTIRGFHCADIVNRHITKTETLAAIIGPIFLPMGRSWLRCNFYPETSVRHLSARPLMQISLKLPEPFQQEFRVFKENA